jgi:hypothetical protein
MVAPGHLEDVNKDQESFVKKYSRKKTSRKAIESLCPLKKENKVDNDSSPPPPKSINNKVNPFYSQAMLHTWFMEV